MGLSGINSRFFNTTGTIQERSTGTTSTGDLTESWSNFLVDVPSTVQAFKVTEHESLPQGAEYSVDNKAYIPLNAANLTVKEGMRFIDNETGKTWDIVKIEEFRSANSSITAGHHIRLLLQISRKPNA